MEDILDIYAKPYDPEIVYLAIDEKGKELQKDQREGQPMKPGQVARYDSEYIREGSCNLFVAYNIQTGQRHIEVTSQRRAEDWAKFLNYLATKVYPEARKIVIVCDNLNIHDSSALYEVYEAPLARSIAQRLEYHYTPVHASWLNMAEIELSALESQCLRRRMGSIEFVKQEVAAWETDRNAKGVKIEWLFTIEKARVKMDWAYPKREPEFADQGLLHLDLTEEMVTGFMC